jgi:hypothetical protein
MNSHTRALTVVAITSFLAIEGCSTNPVTGKSQLVNIS